LLKETWAVGVAVLNEPSDKDVAAAPDAQELLREVAELHARDKQQSAELAAAYANLESLAYSVSHDLRAPLRSMDGFGEILESDFGGQLGEEGLRLVGIIRAASQKMDELIVALLEFSRVAKGPLQPDRIDMTRLAEAAAREVR
jgi:signal transduction histidine kinase